MTKKIDIFIDGAYLWSTNYFKTCKRAKENVWDTYLNINDSSYTVSRFLNRKYPQLTDKRIKACFDHEYRR